MATKKTLKVYRLFDEGFGQPTIRSMVYGKASKRIWHVAAYSAKQALLLARHDVWHKCGTAGIVEMSGYGSAPLWHDWKDWQGNLSSDCRYAFNKAFKG